MSESQKLPWSATTCEVCEGSGALPIDGTWPPDRPCMPTILPGLAVCWYCKGSGWYEAAT